MKKLIRIIAFLLASTASAASTLQDGVINTLIGLNSADGSPALGTPMSYCYGMTVDAVGNIYYSEYYYHRIRRVDAGSGLLSTVVGDGTAGFLGDGGPASSARLNYPMGLHYVSTYSGDYLYVADSANQRIRRIDLSTGLISTVAGSGAKGFTGDSGPAVVASLDTPNGVFADTNNLIWVADTNNNRIRHIDGNGIISTVVGSGSTVYSGDGGLSISSGLPKPLAIEAGSNNNLYIISGNRVRRTTSKTGGNITTTAGIGVSGYTGDGGTGVLARISSTDLALDSSNNVYLADWTNHRLRRVNASDGRITTVAGTGSAGSTGDGGPAMSAKLYYPRVVALSGAGNIFHNDFYGFVIRKTLSATSVIDTVAGGAVSTSGGQASEFPLNNPNKLAGSGGDLYIGDGSGIRLWKHSGSTGLVSHYLGSGEYGSSPDGTTRTAVDIGYISSWATDATGNLFYGDDYFNCIRRISAASGNVRTVVGDCTSNYGYAGDGVPGGASLTAQLSYAYHMATWGTKLYFWDADYNKIRVYDSSTNQVDLVAGSGGYGHVDGPGASAEFNLEYAGGALAVDSSGDLYVADAYNNTIRHIDMNGNSVVSTISGLGPLQAGYSGDGGLAVNAALKNPAAIWFDSADNLYIADTRNQRIRRIDKLTGIIQTVSGSGLRGNSGDGGPSRQAQFQNPYQGLMDANGDMVFCDTSNNRIRKVSYAQTPTPTPISTGPGKPVAYPSPADKQVCFSYHSSGAGRIVIEVYNMAMQLAARIEDSALGSGPQTSCADVSGFVTGAFVYRMTLPDGTSALGKFKVIH